MPHYIGTLPGGRREVFRSNVTPTRANTGGRYKSYRGPMSEIAAHYLKYRDENGYPALPAGTTAAGLHTLAETDQDFYWQALRVVLNAPAADELVMQEVEAAEYNPDTQAETGYPVFIPHQYAKT
ncbi:MAG: hypothetical protein CVU44_22915 [Chloroflexi bacterium HGW-Chloroflexi-6]|nr:MAG: hypothetical protein CVU44_22915 [Chloroflexi bacterium HGW-Chloroflexi-6]